MSSSDPEPGSPPQPRAPRAPRPPGTFRIGSIAGSDVLVSSSWFLVAALIAFVMEPRVEEMQPGLGGWKYVVGVVFAIVLYLAVLLHEAAHAVAARRYGFEVHSITLHFLGGVTAIEGEARTPRQEFWIAVVGPITSLAVGGAAVALWFVTPDGVLLLTVEGLAGANLLIGVLNLVPGLPLDGGRVLKAAVWRVTGRVETGVIAAGWGGRVTAVAVLSWPLFQERVTGLDTTLLDMVLAFVIAMFLWTGASQAIAAARIRTRLGEVVARDLARRTLAVPDDLPLAEAIRRAREANAGSIVTVSAAGSPLGVVDESALRAMPEDRRPWVAVSAVTRSLEEGLRLPVTITGADLLHAIRRTPASEYLLVEPDGSVYGVLATADVERVVRAG
ncbi:site-2 protease family protein [Nocardioides bizhenqiangii]|uniref:Zinc metalloprotease n=1 Tax=Nocardioides bizhenqiangii TaxID=3095076 RepID=A0ABZ0ZJJ0_9ACTN|nr:MULTISPECIES: site-2 protease family protein [unclassified Nocardioides]MDZ5620214.1 site-2 protease family protein [Nocardioides sp. HM23]WQQ24590.1 site-2 protease family protein [Nocardioides sp. HM61]